jgi:golgi phosphoprotein 3
VRQTAVMKLLLAEEIFLLAYNEESGRSNGTLALDNGLAGGLLLDLAAEELVVAEGKDLRAVPGTASHPILAAAHAELLHSDRTRTASHWVNKLPAALKPLRLMVGQSLAERGVLSEQHRKVLGIFPATSWPEVDPAPELELRRRLAGVLVEDAAPDPHTALLIAVLSPLAMVRGLVGKEQRKHADARATQIARDSATGAATSAAVSSSVQAVQSAIMVAVLIPAITTVTT